MGLLELRAKLLEHGLRQVVHIAGLAPQIESTCMDQRNVE
jgi:hypothetical protein